MALWLNSKEVLLTRLTQIRLRLLPRNNNIKDLQEAKTSILKYKIGKYGN
jgi:hypothetical protein